MPRPDTFEFWWELHVVKYVLHDIVDQCSIPREQFIAALEDSYKHGAHRYRGFTVYLMELYGFTPALAECVNIKIRLMAYKAACRRAYNRGQHDSFHRIVEACEKDESGVLVDILKAKVGKQ